MKKIRELMFNPIELSSMTKPGAFYWGLITPQLFIYLFVALFFCSQSVAKLVAVISKEKVEESVESGMQLNVKSLSVDELKNAQKLMRYLEPTVDIKINETAEKPELILSIAKVESYDKFREALFMIQSAAGNAIWTAEVICLGNCAGAAASATLTAVTQTIQMKGTQ
jgi:hypothetical protein